MPDNYGKNLEKQNILILIYFHCNNGDTKAPKYYVYTYIACLAKCQTQRYIMSALTVEELV
jgi:hypothetical protein